METDLSPTSECTKNNESNSDFNELDSLDVNNYELPVTELFDIYKSILW